MESWTQFLMKMAIIVVVTLAATAYAEAAPGNRAAVNTFLGGDA